MHNDNSNNSRFRIEDRRKQVASMLAQSMTETEISRKARERKVGKMMVSNKTLNSASVECFKGYWFVITLKR
jgi:hypothetical protein